jgi:hypothetical protein
VPEDPRSGATRGRDHRRYRRAGRRGNSISGRSAPPKDESVGATRNSIAGKAGDACVGKPGSASEALQGGVRKAGRPAGTTQTGSAETSETRSTPATERDGTGVTRSPGQLGCRTAGTAKWTEEAGQPVESSPARMQRAESGQPGAASSPSRRVQRPGQLGFSRAG